MLLALPAAIYCPRRGTSPGLSSRPLEYETCPRATGCGTPTPGNKAHRQPVQRQVALPQGQVYLPTGAGVMADPATHCPE